MRCHSCGYENTVEDDQCEVCHASLSDSTVGDFDRELAEAISADPLSVLDPVAAVAVSPNTTVAEAVRLLAERNIGCVLVASSDKLLGIFSERDALLRIGATYHDVAGRPVTEFMTGDPQTLSPTDSIAFALNRMDVNDFRHIPIEEDGKVVGIISVRDCLAYVTRHFPELSANAN
jgi:CBS domain-containing protein